MRVKAERWLMMRNQKLGGRELGSVSKKVNASSSSTPRGDDVCHGS